MNSKNKKIILTLTRLIIYEIWESRNNYKYEKINLTQRTIINEINFQLRITLNAHFKIHRLNDTLQQFEKLFWINNALAKIENNKLTILTKPVI